MPFTQWRIQRARAKQKRIALQMLALSGVVRPSHVEPRYSVPLLKLKALNQAQPYGVPSQTEPFHSANHPSAVRRPAAKEMMAALFTIDLSPTQWFKRFDDARAGIARS